MIDSSVKINEKGEPFLLNKLDTSNFDSWQDELKNSLAGILEDDFIFSGLSELTKEWKSLETVENINKNSSVNNDNQAEESSNNDLYEEEILIPFSNKNINNQRIDFLHFSNIFTENTDDDVSYRNNR